MGLYIFITSLLGYFVTSITNNSYCLLLQLSLSACLIGYPFIYSISKKVRAIPSWCIGLCWLVWLAVYLPLNLVWNWWNSVNPIFTTSLFSTHCTVILWVLPLYLGISIVATALLVSIYPIYTRLPLPVLSSLFPLFTAILLMFSVIIYLKVKQDRYKTKILYLKKQEEIRASQKIKSSLYEAILVPATAMSMPKGNGSILNQVVHKIEESIFFLDSDTPLYKQDLQSIINKFYDWVAYFNKREREKAKKHTLLKPAKITLDKLMHKVEVALSQEVSDPPRLLIEKISGPHGKPYPDMICDIHQVVYLLVQSVLRIGKLLHDGTSVVRIQLHDTTLQFKQADPIENHYPTFIDFPANESKYVKKTNNWNQSFRQFNSAYIE